MTETSAVPSVTLDTLPDVALEKVLSFLDYEDLLSCCRCSQRLRNASDSVILWKRLCNLYWLQTKCPEALSWKEHFKAFYKDYSRYVNVYRVIRKAWNKIEAYLKENVPEIFTDLNAGVTEEHLDVSAKENRLTYPDDMRCSYRIHNGQKSEGITAGMLGSHAVYHMVTNNTLFPLDAGWEYLDNPEESFSDFHILGYCYKTHVAQVIALSEDGGHKVGEVFYTVPDVTMLHTSDPLFMLDKFIIANSYTEWLTSYANDLEKNMFPIINDRIYRFYREPDCVVTSHHIQVTAATTFLPRLSSIHPPKFAFAYRITLTMPEDAPKSASCKLQTRHWVIEEDGNEERVDGPGVVGEFPVMTPGSTFSWISSTSFRSAEGYMKGHFTMRKLSTGEEVNVVCPRYHMKSPPFQTWEERRDLVKKRRAEQEQKGLPFTRDTGELDMHERGQYCGFNEEDALELFSYGMKPWDTEACDFLDQLRAQRAEYEDEDSD